MFNIWKKISRLAEEMRKSLLIESRKDTLLTTQKVSIKKDQVFDYSGFKFSLDTRCKWDWFIPIGFGGDLKRQQLYKNNLKTRWLFYGIATLVYGYRDRYSNLKKRIAKSSNILSHVAMPYERGKEKYLDLAFKYWQLIV